jgi:hypothetical protein
LWHRGCIPSQELPGEFQFARTGIHQLKEIVMALLTTTLAASTGTAAGFSLVYLLAGGGLLGAALIFFVAKML